MSISRSARGLLKRLLGVVGSPGFLQIASRESPKTSGVVFHLVFRFLISGHVEDYVGLCYSAVVVLVVVYLSEGWLGGDFKAGKHL